MFEGQPRGLFALALANTGERFGYYTMLAVFVLFLQENFGWSAGLAGTYYSTFLMFVYFLPFIGGILADKFGYGKMVKIGISVMFLGYVLLAVPLGNGGAAVGAVIGALALISIGTGLFKGNLQVMVGDLYASPEMASKRDSAFSLFYMAINIGALFAPTAAVEIMKYAQKSLGFEKADSYHFAFGVACISLIISILIYFATRSTFRQVEGGHTAVAASDKGKSVATEPELSKEDTKARIVALCLVFAVVIFFWMAFHQNGLTLTYFAAEFTQQSATGIPSMLFDVKNLVMVIIAIYASFAVVQSKTQKARIIATAVTLLCAVGIIYNGLTVGNHTVYYVSAPIFQQFNPCFVVGLTPVSVALFGWLASRKKEPTAPRKIAYGMIVAAIGFGIMIFGSTGISPLENQVTKKFNIEEQLKAQKEANDKEFKAFTAKVEDNFKQQKEKIEVEVQKVQKQEEANKFAALSTAKDLKQKADIKLNSNLTKIKQDALKNQEIQKLRNEADAKIKAFETSIQEKNLVADTEAKVNKAQVEADIEASGMRVSPNWLILTYLILTFAELLLSPMGISFVSKVAPPKYKGMMMGGWFVATAIGNFLTVIPALLWCKVPLVVVWGVLAGLCLLSFLFIFSQMKKLEKVA